MTLAHELTEEKVGGNDVNQQKFFRNATYIILAGEAAILGFATAKADFDASNWEDWATAGSRAAAVAIAFMGTKLGLHFLTQKQDTITSELAVKLFGVGSIGLGLFAAAYNGADIAEHISENEAADIQTQVGENYDEIVKGHKDDLADLENTARRLNSELQEARGDLADGSVDNDAAARRDIARLEPQIQTIEEQISAKRALLDQARASQVSAINQGTEGLTDDETQYSFWGTGLGTIFGAATPLAAGSHHASTMLKNKLNPSKLEALSKDDLARAPLNPQEALYYVKIIASGYQSPEGRQVRVQETASRMLAGEKDEERKQKIKDAIDYLVTTEEGKKQIQKAFEQLDSRIEIIQQEVEIENNKVRRRLVEERQDLEDMQPR